MSRAEQQRARTTELLAVVALLVLAVCVDRLRARVVGRLHKVKELSDVYALPPPAYVKRVALGYDDAVVSVVWASVLFQYGEHVGQNRRFPYATQYVDTILFLDPSFRPAYKFLSTFVTMQAVAPERFELDRVRQTLQSGTRANPNDPDAWGAYATFMLFDGAQYLAADEKKAWRIEGAAAAERAVELGYFLDTLGISGAIYLEESGYRDLAVAQLERAYAVAINDETRQRIMNRLERLKANAAIERLRRGEIEFYQTWGKQAPFASEALFMVIGPRRDTEACVGLSGLEPRCKIGWVR